MPQLSSMELNYINLGMDGYRERISSSSPSNDERTHERTIINNVRAPDTRGEHMASGVAWSEDLLDFVLSIHRWPVDNRYFADRSLGIT